MPDRHPEIAAQHSQASLQVLVELFPGAEARVRARLSPEVREALEAAVRSDYLPARVDVALAAAIVAELGLPAARRVARAVLHRNFTGSLLGALVSSAKALFGPTPAGVLRWAGRGWSRVCRDCGELHFLGSAEGAVTLRLEALPAELDVPDYLEAVAGGLEGLLDVCGVEGSASVSREPQGVRFELRYHPRPEPG